MQAAHAARATGTPPPKLFDAAAVGAAGAGFDHHAQRGYGVTDAERLTAIVLPSVELVQARATILANASDTASSGDEDEAGGGAAAEAVAARGDGSDPDRLFKTEVEETLLRTMQLARDSQQAMQDMTQNAVIELNGLKIAGAPFLLAYLTFFLSPACGPFAALCAQLTAPWRCNRYCNGPCVARKRCTVADGERCVQKSARLRTARATFSPRSWTSRRRRSRACCRAIAASLRRRPRTSRVRQASRRYGQGSARRSPRGRPRCASSCTATTISSSCC